MLVVAVLVWLAATSAVAAEDVPPPPPPAPLLEAADCHSEPPDIVSWDGSIAGPSAVPGPAVTVPGAGGAQEVSVTVPRLALLRVDESGHVVAAVTNTGCAPQPSDATYVVTPSGEHVATPGERFAHLRFTGDFREAGRWIDQRMPATDG